MIQDDLLYCSLAALNVIEDCLIPELKASCGEEAVQLYDEEFTVAFETLNDIYKNEQIDEEDWPKECQLLGEKI
ncbi:Isocitrate dehydrogenase kinase/phosphatase [Trichinella pseudospiralis]